MKNEKSETESLAWQKIKFWNYKKFNPLKLFQATIFIGKVKKFGQIAGKILKKMFWKDKVLAFLLGGGLFFIIAAGSIIFYKIKPSDSEVILHYNSYFGIDVVSFNLKEFYFQVFLGPLAVLLVWFLNLILIFYLLFFQEKQQRVFKQKKEPKKTISSGGLTHMTNQQILFFFSLLARFLAGGCFIIGVAIFIYALAIVFIN